MNGYPPPMNPYMNSGNMYMQPPPPTAPSSQLQQPQQQQQQQQATSSSAAAAMPSAPSAASVATAVGAQKYWQPSYNDELQRQQQKKAQLEKNTLDELKAELEETDALQPTINEAAIEQLAKKVSELNPSDDNVVGATNKADQSQQHQQGNRRRYDNNYRGGRGGRYIHNFTIPTSEFDFEASNAKFDKSEIVKKDHHHHEAEEEEEEEIEIPQSDEFYDKVKKIVAVEERKGEKQKLIDFILYRPQVSLIIFLVNPKNVMNNVKSSKYHSSLYTVSCSKHDILIYNYSEPRRSHFHEERKLNLETFGQATVDQSRYRNNYRGGRGGNNYRGGGHRGHRGGNNYRHHHNNRNNYNNNGFRQNKVKFFLYACWQIR